MQWPIPEVPINSMTWRHLYSMTTHPHRIVTLYEHVATHLCALFAVTPAHHIHTMVGSLHVGNGQHSNIVYTYQRRSDRVVGVTNESLSRACTYIPTFFCLEYCLLKYVTSPWQPVSLLSCDVWIFFAR